MTKVAFIGLGCEKNIINTEKMMATCQNAGFTLTDELEGADVAIINTCGFIESAKAEALETFFEVAQLKAEGKVKKILLAGCLVQRYQEEIAKELPEADGFIGVGSFQNVADAVNAVMAEEAVAAFGPVEDLQLEGDRILTSPAATSYLKVADGCSNKCAYCCIPLIRGPFKSRPMENIINEAKKLAAEGTRELILIAQDTTNYGFDLYGERKLCALLKELVKIDGLQWIRLLYLYPDKVTKELIDLMAKEEKILPYVEMPIQHAAGPVLKAMNRPGDDQSLLKTIEDFRKKLPQITLRTTLIVGFPGETEEDFETLCNFVRKAKFDKLGVFTFSPEEGTPAFEMEDQIEEEVKERRQEILEMIQAEIMEEKQSALIGQELTVLVEGYDRFGECWFGRSFMEAPDIDGKIFFTAEEPMQIGAFAQVEISDIIDFDLMGFAKG